MGLSAKKIPIYDDLYQNWMTHLGKLNGSGEYMVEANTYQFTDYLHYHASAIDPFKKACYRDEHFPIALEEAYDLGVRLAEKS